MLKLFKLVKTCGGCPESYDVYLADTYNPDSEWNNCIGYMRLRYDSFNVYYRNDHVYNARAEGDGIFESNEREFFLNQGCLAIQKAMEDNNNDETIFDMA